MKHYIQAALLGLLTCTSSLLPFKILHLSFHRGCINDFREVANQLNLDLTDWYILNSRENFDPLAKGNDIYNITSDRADRVWGLNKDYFNEFDAIITSDTAPLCRIFLQNNWQKPLIIWICNRFDYHDAADNESDFPDSEYYDLFRAAIDKPNVKIISYTPYEHFYAHKKDVKIDTLTIRPLGCLTHKAPDNFISHIPSTICKENTIFIYPRLEPEQEKYLKCKCEELGINAYYGIYNGPDDLSAFKGIIYFPYQWSNLALFENIQRGIVHFVPSLKFITNALKQKEPIRYHSLEHLELCEWYCDEYKDLFVYFDSWQDLVEKINTTNYLQMKQKILEAGVTHWYKNFELWEKIFSNLAINTW